MKHGFTAIFEREGDGISRIAPSPSQLSGALGTAGRPGGTGPLPRRVPTGVSPADSSRAPCVPVSERLGILLAAMSLSIVLVLAILLMAVLLFLTERLRFDVSAMLVLLALTLTGLLSFEEAFAGFSNEAVVTVASVLVLSGALARTGVANMIGDRVLQVAGNSTTGLLIAMMTTVGILSGFMNDIGVTALMLPVVVDMARRTQCPPSKLLIPLAFGSLLGGMTTLIGTTPNILISAALHEAGLRPFQLFDFSPIGYAALGAGILYMVTLGQRLLPTRRSPEARESVSPSSLAERFGISGVLFGVTVPEDSWLVGRTLAASRLGSALGITVISLHREGRQHVAPQPGFRLRSGDTVLMSGRGELLRALQAWRNLELAESEMPLSEIPAAGLGFAEVTLGKGRAGATLADWDTRSRFGVSVLGVRQAGQVRLTHLSRLGLGEGDHLLVVGSQEGLQRLGEGLSPEDGYRLLSPEEVEREYGLDRRLKEVRVPDGSALDGMPLAETQLGQAFGLHVLSIRRDHARLWLPGPADPLRANDILLVEGRRSDFALLGALQELEPGPPASTIEALSTEHHGFAEFMLQPRSPQLRARVRDLLIRQRYGLNVLAIWHGERAFRSGLADRTLELGDTLLMHGPRSKIEELASNPDFICLTRADATPYRFKRAPLAAAIMGGVVLLVLSGALPIYVAAPAGALGMVLSRCLSMEEAYRYISLRAILLIAGMLSLGRAMQTSGTAELIATTALGWLASFGTLALIGGLFLVTALSAQVMPTAAVAVLMAPIGLSTADNLGLSPHAILMTVALGSSCAFLSPVGHPVNLLVMGVGGYRFTDYARVGLPLLLVVFLVVLLLLPVVWPLSPDHP